MKLPIVKIVKLYQAIELVRSRADLKKKFSYALIKTKAQIKPVYDAVAEMEKVPPELLAFETERLEAAHRFARRKENGDVETEGTVIKLDDPQAYAAALSSLRDKYHAPLAAYESAQKEVGQHVLEEDSVDICQVPFDMFPEVISPEMLEALEPMIETESKS